MMLADLMRWSGMAAILAGVLLIVSLLLTELVAEGFFYLFALVFLLLAVALPGLHARQVGRSGLLGRIGFVAALIGAVAFVVLLAVVGVAENFFGFDPDASDVVGLVLFVAFIAFMVGIVIFGIATASSAAHPLKSAPNRVDKAMLRVAMQAPHRLVLAPGVLQAQERPATFGGMPWRLSAALTALAGPEARPVAAGALFALVPEALNPFLRGLLRGTR